MPIVKKKSATRNQCDPFSPFSIQVGQEPVPDTTSPEGYRQLRAWQITACRALSDFILGILIAPTASGKSTVLKVLAYNLALKNERTIIAVPETTIAKSFRPEHEVDFKLPDGTVMTWEVPPQNILFDQADPSGKGTVNRLIKWLQTPRATPEGRILICTHAALVLAHQKLMVGWNGRKKSPWKGVNIFIDEGHHSKAPGEDNTKVESNKLGSVVEHYTNKQPGRLLLTTATWLRNDMVDIVPPDKLELFTQYEYPIHEYLEKLAYLREIVFKFTVVDNYATALKALARDRKRTIVYLPPVRPGENGKLKLLKAFQNSLGEPRPSKNGFTLTHKRSRIKSLDLVTPEGRPRIQAAFDANPKEPDFIFVQNLFREGADWPIAERSIVCGTRGSLPMLIQMLGRLLRDHLNKERVEFHILLLKSEVESTASQFTAYTSTLFQVMALGFQFSSTHIDPALRSQRGIQEIVNVLAKEAFQGTSTNAEVTVQDAVRNVVRTLGGGNACHVASTSRTLLSCMQGAFRVAAKALGLTGRNAQKLEAIIKENPFKATEMLYEARIGPKRFREYREAFIGLPEATTAASKREIFLERCKYYQYDPRKVKGAVAGFGSKQALNEACSELGL